MRSQVRQYSPTFLAAVCGKACRAAVLTLFVRNQFADQDLCTYFLLLTFWVVFGKNKCSKCPQEVLKMYRRCTQDVFERSAVLNLRIDFNRGVETERWYRFLLSFSKLGVFYFSHKSWRHSFSLHSSGSHATKLHRFLKSQTTAIQKYIAWKIQ